MKVVIQFFIVCNLLISFNTVQAQSANEAAIVKVLLLQVKDWNEGNIDSFMDGYWQSDSLLFLGNTGITKGWQKMLENYKTSYPDTFAMGKLSLDLIEIKRITDLDYFVAGKWNLKRINSSLGGTFSLLFRKIKNKWVIVADHST